MKSFLPILFALFLLTACVGNGERMRRDLDALQEKNLADSLLTDSTLAMTLADYFDRHGTQAERLEAHYLLARTWTDLDQAPRALDAFHTAAEQADTTRLDSLSCHWLSRIYGQMGGLLHNHQLPYNAIDAYSKAEHYALECNEMAIAALFFEQTAACYYLLGDMDQAVKVMEQTYHRLLALNDTISANLCLGPLSFAATKSNDYEKAKDFIEMYEHHSIYSDEASNNYNRWKLLHCDKGFYYLGIGKADSALHYFKKAYNECQDARDLTLACQGLYLTYDKLSQPDSTAKYAVLYAQTNDSTFLHSVSSSLLSMQHLYDYNRMQSIAKQKTADAKKAKSLAVLLFLFAAGMLILVSLWGVKVRRNRIRARQKYEANLRLLKKKEADNLLLQMHKDDLQNLIDENGQVIRQLQEEIRRYEQEYGVECSSDEDRLNEIEICRTFREMAYTAEKPTEEEWQALFDVLQESLPAFSRFMEEHANILNNTEYRTCYLIRIHVNVKGISNILGVSAPYISRIRKEMLRTLFRVSGSPAVFDKKLLSIKEGQ